MAGSVDVQLFKRKMFGSGPNAPMNCAVVSNGHEVHLLVDKIKPPKRLQDELLKELAGEQIRAAHSYFGTVYPDAALGALVMTLNKSSAPGLAKLLTAALRGSGYHKITINGTAEI